MPDFNRSKKLIAEEHRLVPRSRRDRLRIARRRSIYPSDRRIINQQEHQFPANNQSSENVNGEVQITGFARGLEAERILGNERNVDGGLMFVVSWKDEVETDLIAASEVYQHIPQLAIAYFREQLDDNDLMPLNPRASDSDSDTEEFSTDEISYTDESFYSDESFYTDDDNYN